ncbi:hypothetical protein THAOC_15701 [Thalassiosira oceanica]|uniref:Uncharacterized protein n=1 Tax=Thalassiosira oceanica TaxID=159749 RepID=K0SF60_THAOC|nr:hypothetical protein THAOC_15701 [Thalassiosira oceanica]|eukprot:EJK63629.1 hypothetical protein THAOC_15701 [Thalassiosira oceanica]
MTIDDQQELGICIGVWVRVLMLGRLVEGTDSLASIISSQDRTTGLQQSAAQPRATGTTEKTRAEGTAGPPTIATVVHTKAGCGDDPMATKQSRPILLQDDRSGVREDFGRRSPPSSLRTVTTRRPSILHPFLIYHRQAWPHRIAVVVLSLCHHHDCRAVPRPHNRFGPPSSTPRVSRECLRRLARTWYGDLDPKSEKIEDVTPFVDASTNLMPFLDTASLITTSLLGCEQLLKFSRHRLRGIIYLPMVCPACYGDEEIKARLNNMSLHHQLQQEALEALSSNLPAKTTYARLERASRNELSLRLSSDTIV